MRITCSAERPSWPSASRVTCAQRARCVEVRAFVDADREPIDELTAKPAGDECEHAAAKSGGQGERFRLGGCVHAQQRADGVQRDDNEIAAAVKRADALGASARWNRQPVDKAKRRRSQSADEASD